MVISEHTEETLSLKEWEEKLLVFLRDTLAVVSDNTWICQLSQEMCKQLPSYNGTPQEKVPKTSQLGSGISQFCAFVS